MWLTGLARSRALYRREFQVSRAGSPMYSSSLALPFPFFLPRRRKQSKVDFARQSADAEPMVRWVRSGALTGAPTLVEQLGGAFGELANQAGLRSEEHTSELQSLMRISYAVFCLKKKKTERTPRKN